MTQYRNHLPQLDGGLFLTDGGLETTLVFHEKIDLPCFAAFDLMRDREGKALLRDYYVRYADLARRDGYGFILESPTWRASADWGDGLGYSREALAAVNRESIELMEELRREFQSPAMPVVISGCVGPRGDGYDPGVLMTPDEAETYHGEQIGTFAGTAADMITAITMTNVEEAIGIARAATGVGMPVAISFTLETDGRLPTGQRLGDAIAAVDEATAAAPGYYMINCAHPTHFAAELADAGSWRGRIRGLRANASRCSHAELDTATELDDGDPAELGGQYRDLLRQNPQVVVVGGCCGTDHRHIDQISRACRMAA
jgi:S-methylmethionine-dependent homocysteine/selenocysteine methylase